jgi:hypothetical protein
VRPTKRCAEVWPPSAFHRTTPNQAIHSALWLHHDFLEESHEISQELHTPTGSFLHAIMHRREPDAFNSKYWWRRVGVHPVFAELALAANALGYKLPGKQWDAAYFTDDCDRTRGTGTPHELLLQQIQAKELELLLKFCIQSASR